MLLEAKICLKNYSEIVYRMNVKRRSEYSNTIKGLGVYDKNLYIMNCFKLFLLIDSLFHRNLY